MSSSRVRVPTLLFLICLAACSKDTPNVIDAGASGSSGAGGAPIAGTAAPQSGAGGAPSGGSGGAGRGAAGSTGRAAAGGGGVGGAAATGGAGASAGGAGAAAAGTGAGGSSAPSSVQSLVCPSGTSYGDPLPSNRTAALVKNGFNFLEGPLWIAKQSVLLFSNMNFDTSNNPNGPDSQIQRLTPPDQVDVLVASSGSNGLALGVDGNIVAATHDIQSLSKFDATTGAREKLDLRYMDKHFNSPNDVAVRSDGTLYFTDPDWQLGPRMSETKLTGLYRVALDGMVSLVDGTLDKPNGIALSPDEKTLYVGSAGKDIISFALDSAGVPSMRKTFASVARNSGGSDGMSIDCAGNLYVVAGTIEVFSSAGMKLGDITVSQQPSNVAFGGPKQQTLYITAESGLYKLDVNVPGRAY